VDNGGSLSLGFGKDYIDEISGWWDDFDVLEIVTHSSMLKL